VFHQKNPNEHRDNTRTSRIKYCIEEWDGVKTKGIWTRKRYY